MTKSRNKTIEKSEARSWSRREVISTAARVASALAVPQLWLPKAWGATTTFDYYISTSGKDSNSGTLASPWALTSFEDTNPNNRLMAGKRIGLIAGNYSTAGITPPILRRRLHLLAVEYSRREPWFINVHCLV